MTTDSPNNYGSIDDNNRTRPPIHLHASLESLDIGPHAYRQQHTTSSPPPQDHNRDGRSATPDESPNLLTSPLLRTLSLNADPLTNPNLITPVLEASEVQVSNEKKSHSFILYIVYALVNSIMCIPCLYGYASVIFNHEVYQPHISALSKLVILSSVVHQFCFSTFSSLPFSIGQVQDAGLIFLSAMSHKIATSLINSGGSDEEILSTTIVLLGLSTACLGAVLIVAGKFKIADAVAYLPLPVVGGYLAFIGYFCVEAGVALCIGHTIMVPRKVRSLILALPGILAGIFLTFVARKCTDEAMLPLSMVLIPTLFYIILFVRGWSIEDARDGGWVGEQSPAVPFQDLFSLVDFSKVHWSLAKDIVATWAGMVFVVSFSSCLDVAAISMDMGESLDTNNELMTVGISNLLSGLTGGFTGSYIFSQTIFTYRTGCRSRWIGIIVALTFVAVVVSTVNFLEVTPLFFLGSTLLFIGFDLMFEWLIEVRHKLLFSEYAVLLATFFAIQFLGINGGIGLGIAVAIFDFVWTTATVSSVVRVSRRSLMLWSPQQRLFINEQYNTGRIVTLQLRGSVFFGSSMTVLSNILDQAGVPASVDEQAEINKANSPIPHRRVNSLRIPSSLSPSTVSPGSGSLSKRRQERSQQQPKKKQLIMSTNRRAPPRFLVLDLASVSNVDASAARGCFLQLAKMCNKRKITVCASGANNRINWLLETHDTAQHLDIDTLASEGLGSNEKILLFDDIDEALQFAEKTLIDESSDVTSNRLGALSTADGVNSRISLSTAFTTFLGLEKEDAEALVEYEKGHKAFHIETLYTKGETIFSSGDKSDGFFVILQGSIIVLLDDASRGGASTIFSGGGIRVRNRRRITESGKASRVQTVGSVFGFVDYVLNRNRSFTVVAGKECLVAKCKRSGLDELKRENPNLDRIVDKVLLLCSVVELASLEHR